MAIKHYYQLSYPTILMYYNLLGVDTKTLDINQIETEVSDLEYLVPCALELLPQSSQKINQEWLEILEKMCTYFEYSSEGEALQQFYMKSIIGILNTATSLNLMEEERVDYILHFERLNEILSYVLAQINCMEVREVYELFGAIQNSDSKKIYEAIKVYPAICLFCYLAMSDNENSEDYRMFENENSSKINMNNLWEVILKNAHKNKEFKVLKRDFVRLSFKDAKALSIQK